MDDLSEMAESIAIIMDDMGHPIPAYNHWVIWNIPAISLIPENIPHGEQVDSLGAIQGCGYGKHRYRGLSHHLIGHIFITLMSFRWIVVLIYQALPEKKDLLAAMQGHILQKSVLAGHYR